MDKYELLAKKLQDLKEELIKDSRSPSMAPKDVKVKELQGKIDAGTYKPDAAKIADKMVKADSVRPDAGFGKVTVKDTNPKPNYSKVVVKDDGCMMMSEELMCHENGQWNFKKSAFKELEHKLEGEGKSKESAGAIAYTVGKEKYGKAGMERKAEAAKKSEDESC